MIFNSLYEIDFNLIDINYYLIFMTWMFEVVYGLLGYSQEVYFLNGYSQEVA